MNQPPVFHMDYGMFRFLLGWEGEGPVPREWTTQHLETLKKLDVAYELEGYFMAMVAAFQYFTSKEEKARDVHPVAIVEAVEAQILLNALLDIIAASTDQPVAKEAKKNPVVKLAKSDPKIAIALAFTAGQLISNALNRVDEKRYARSRTRYDNIDLANAAKDKRPPSKDEFLKLVAQAESRFKKKESQNKWLQQQLGCSRATIHRYYKRFGVS